MLLQLCDSALSLVVVPSGNGVAPAPSRMVICPRAASRDPDAHRLPGANSIRRTATENSLWGEERIANELLLKLGLRVSPRTVRKYMPKPTAGSRARDRAGVGPGSDGINRPSSLPATSAAVTATFRLFYVLVLIEHGSRRLVHLNVTQHPTADWTLQQLREAIGCDRLPISSPRPRQHLRQELGPIHQESWVACVRSPLHSAQGQRDLRARDRNDSM